MSWKRYALLMQRERNEMADRLGAAELAVELIASEMRIVLGTDAVRLPVIEHHLDAYYSRLRREWRSR